MKNHFINGSLFLSIFFLISYPAISQDCPDIEVFYQYDETNTDVTQSDASISILGEIYFASNFLFDQSETVSSVCWLGGTILNKSVPLERNISTRSLDDCNIEPLAVNITYYTDNAGLPGEIYNNSSFIIENPGYITLPTNVCKYSIDHTPVEFAPFTDYWISISADVSGACDYVLVGESTNNNIKGRNKSNKNLRGTFGSANYSAEQNWVRVPDFCASFILSHSSDPIPTLSQWGLIILGMCIIIVGLIRIKEKLYTTVT